MLEPRVGPLAPGIYRVVATTEDSPTASVEVTVSGQPLQRVALRLKD